MELRRKVETLQRDIDLRLAEIKRLESQATARPAIEGAKIPQVVVLRFDRYTGGADTDNDGGDDTLRVYIKPMDQRGRFIVVAGSATLQAVAITPGQPPVLVVEKTLSPAEWDAAYRTGMTGTHYSIEAALPRPLPEGVTELTVKVTLTDAAGGATISQEQAVKLRRAAAK